MSEGFFCLLSIILAAGTAVWMTLLFRGANIASVSMFQGWKDVLQAWRAAESRRERSLIAALAIGQSLRSGAAALITAVFAGMAAIIGALCGPDALKILRELRGILEDFYQFYLQRQPVEVAMLPSPRRNAIPLP